MACVISPLGPVDHDDALLDSVLEIGRFYNW